MGAGGVQAPTRGREGTEEPRAALARPGSGGESEREVGFSGQVDAVGLCGRRVRVSGQRPGIARRGAPGVAALFWAGV